MNAYRVGDVLAADFRTVVEPPQALPGAASPARETISTHYAEFYRPLVARLRRSDLRPVGRGGWRGRWRSFQTGYPHVVYATGLDQGKAQRSLSIHGNNQQQIYHALIQHRAEIDAELDTGTVWEEGERSSWVMMETEAMITGLEENVETVRQWMADNLVKLRDTVQPHLDLVMGSPGTGEDGGEDAE